MSAILHDPAHKAKGKKPNGTDESTITHAITLLWDDDESGTPINADNLTHEALADVADQLNAGELLTLPITLACCKAFASWPRAARDGFWKLWKALSTSERKLTLRIGDIEFGTPTDLLAAGLVASTSNPDALDQAVGVAADGLAICYPPNAQTIFQAAIIQKLRGLKVDTKTCGVIESSLKQRSKSQKVAPTDGETVIAYELAQQFLAERYPASAGGDGNNASTSKSADTGLPFDLCLYGEEFFRRRPTVWVPASEQEIKLAVASFLQQVTPAKATSRFIGDVFVNVMALVALSIDGTPPLPFKIGDPKQRTLAFKNGSLDLAAISNGKKPKLLPPDRLWLSTSVLDYSYDPTADCPQFKKFLGQILNADPITLTPLTEGDNRVKVVQEIAGSILLTDNRFQKFSVWLGEGGNGKGTLLHVLQNMVGDENCSSETLEGMGRQFGTFSMVGKMVNVSGDMADIDNVQEGTLKTWTGQDLVTVERKHKTSIQILPSIKLIFATNALPWFKDKTQGMWHVATAHRRPVHLHAGERPGSRYHAAIEAAKRTARHSQLGSRGLETSAQTRWLHCV